MHLDSTTLALFRIDLLAWFEHAQRDLAWRRERDPYRIWISEVMSQQTRVEQAEPYYLRFLDAFPSVAALADAELADVLKNWEGLGYYSRARNLHRAASVVMERHAGYLPKSRDELRALPGIGEYTSAAIASLAFGERAAAVDGNVIRVVSRFFALDGDRKSPALRRRVRDIVDVLIPESAPGTFNESLMELGARVCTPRAPACEACPLQAGCIAFGNGTPEAFPQITERRTIPHYDIAVGLVILEGRVFIQKRPDDAMLGGLWEFPGGKVAVEESPEQACIREVLEETGMHVRILTPLAPVRHAYSHFRITMHAYVCSSSNLPVSNGLESRWADAQELEELAFPRANRRILHLAAEFLE